MARRLKRRPDLVGRPRDLSGPLRAITEQVQVQYGETFDGKPLMVWMDVLSCGHRIKSDYKRETFQEGESPLVPLVNRHCKKCPKEEAP